MYYKTIAILENNERAFVEDLLLIINNETVVGITKSLIDKHKINFAELMYQLNNEDIIEFWHNNKLDKFSKDILQCLQRLLLKAYTQIVRNDE